MYPTLAHTDAIVDRYGEAIGGVFKEIAGMLEAAAISPNTCAGPWPTAGFRRLAG